MKHFKIKSYIVFMILVCLFLVNTAFGTKFLHNPCPSDAILIKQGFYNIVAGILFRGPILTVFKLIPFIFLESITVSCILAIILLILMEYAIFWGIAISMGYSGFIGLLACNFGVYGLLILGLLRKKSNEKQSSKTDATIKDTHDTDAPHNI